MAEKKKITFKGISTEEIIKQYKRRHILGYLLYSLVIFIAMFTLNIYSWDMVSPINLVLCLIVCGFAIYVIGNLRQNLLFKYLEILRNDCDPYKFEALYSKVEVKPNKPNQITFNICRALYYQGRFQEAVDRLRAMGKPKEKDVLFFQYYNLMASCYDELNDVEKLVLIREKMGAIVFKMNDKDKFVGNGRMLLTVLDQMLTQKEGRYTKSVELAEEILDNATFPLSRIQATYRLAKLEYERGQSRSAMEHAAYVIDDGGKTFYVDRARELYTLCCGQEYVSEAEQFKRNLEAGMYDENGEE